MPEEIETKPEEIAEEQPKVGFLKKFKIHKFKILAVFLGFLISVGAVFGAYKFGQRQVQPGSQPTPTPGAVATPTPDPTVNWKTYMNMSYLYSVKYPTGEITIVSSMKGTTDIYKAEEVSINIDKNTPGFVLKYLPNSGKLSSEDFAKKELKAQEEAVKREQAPALTIRSQGPITINGIQAYEVTVFAYDRDERKVYISKDDRTILISFPTANNPNDPKAKEHFDTFNLMLSTFRFLPREGQEITPIPTPSISLRKISYRNIPGWPLYKSLLDFDFQYPPDYSLPQKNIVDFMNLGQFYCSFSSSKKVGTGLDYLNFIALPKNYEEKIQRTLKILNVPGYLKKEEVEVYSYPAVLLDLDQSYKHYQKDQAIVVEASSMLLIVNYKQNEINKNWDYILESIRFGPNFDKDYFEEKLNECRG